MPRERLIVFQRGHRVGELAHSLFPGGINLSPGHPSAYRKAVLATGEKIAEGQAVIYEAGFQYDRVLILLDILVKKEDGWHAYEVKSSRAISDTYLLDAALQYYVIEGSGPDIKSISIIHIDETYERGEHIEPERLFKIQDVTAEALDRQQYVNELIAREKETLLLPHSPKIPVGDHCRQPYDCDFIGHCWKNETLPGLKSIPGQLKKDRASETMDYEWDVPAIRLLTMKPAIPLYPGTHPYEEIVYGYCITNSKGNVVDKMIAPPDPNPGLQLINLLSEAVKAYPALLCFGQEHLLSKSLPGKMMHDMEKMLDAGSDFYHRMKDKAPLERLKIIFGLKDLILPDYPSDAIAENEYLNAYRDDAVRTGLFQYIQAWNKAILLMQQHILKH